MKERKKYRKKENNFYNTNENKKTNNLIFQPNFIFSKSDYLLLETLYKRINTKEHIKPSSEKLIQYAKEFERQNFFIFSKIIKNLEIKNFIPLKNSIEMQTFESELTEGKYTNSYSIFEDNTHFFNLNNQNFVVFFQILNQELLFLYHQIIQEKALYHDSLKLVKNSKFISSFNSFSPKLSQIIQQISSHSQKISILRKLYTSAYFVYLLSKKTKN